MCWPPAVCGQLPLSPRSCSSAGLVTFLLAVVYKLIKPSEGHGLRGQSVMVVMEAAGHMAPTHQKRMSVGVGAPSFCFPLFTMFGTPANGMVPPHLGSGLS